MATISTSGISPGQIIRSEHLLRVINALDGVTPIDIIITGSLSVSGSTSFTGSTYLRGLPNTSRANVITYDPTTGQLSYLNSASLGVTMSVSQPGGLNTQIQYNSGSVLAASSSFTFNYLSSSLQQGNNVIANGTFAHAQGNQTTASGQYSHAEGTTTHAKNLGSHAEGVSTIASGSYSHAEGSSTLAQGIAAHSEGVLTLALGAGAHSEGNYTTASGNYSHAEGASTQAIGNNSHAEGLGTISLGNNQHVQGAYNISSSASSAFIIGNGTSDGSRSNLVFASGSTFQITGSLQVSGSITGSFTGSFTGSMTDVQITGSLRLSGSLIATGSIISTGNITAGGNVTASGIYTANFYSDGYSMGISDNYDSSYNFLYQPYVGLQITDIASSVLINQDGSIAFVNSDNANQGILRADSLTAYRQYYLPNLDGTIALTSQIPSSASYATTGSNIFIGNQTITGSLSVTGSITGSLFGTSSWANRAVSSSYVLNAVSASFATSASWAPGSTPSPILLSGTTLYSTNAGPGFSTTDSIVLGTNAGYLATSALRSNFLGNAAGYQAPNANQSNFFGYSAGYFATNASNSNFFGISAGDQATNAQNSNFFGVQTGQLATNANNSNFFGTTTGYSASNASNSNFFGNSAGYTAISASYSTLIGQQVGYNTGGLPSTSIGSNNIIIGTNITLPAQQKDSINLGGIIFATGSYFNTGSFNPFSGSVIGAKVGIGTPTPAYTLDVSGSTRINDILILEPRSTTPGSPTNGMVIVSGSGADQHIYCYLNSTWKQLD